MIVETKIQTFNVFDKDRSGKPLMTKTNKPYRKASIQVDIPEYVGKYLTCLTFSDDAPELQLKPGEIATIVIEPSGSYLNFRIPSKSDLFEARLETLEKRMNYVTEHLGMARPKPTASPEQVLQQAEAKEIPVDNSYGEMPF